MYKQSIPNQSLQYKIMKKMLASQRTNVFRHRQTLGKQSHKKTTHQNLPQKHLLKRTLSVPRERLLCAEVRTLPHARKTCPHSMGTSMAFTAVKLLLWERDARTDIESVCQRSLSYADAQASSKTLRS